MIAGILIVTFGGLAFFGKRWAYALFVLLSLAYISANCGGPRWRKGFSNRHWPDRRGKVLRCRYVYGGRWKRDSAAANENFVFVTS